MSDGDEVTERIAVLLQPYNQGGISIDVHTNLIADLRIDSVAAMDLIMEIEESFGIEIPINLVPDLATVGDLISLVRERVGPP
jgi:acyl carrier protein